MAHAPIKVCRHGSELLAVPAFHYHHLFAVEINRICRQQETRPAAVAVELGAQTVQAVKAWLKELGQGPGCQKKLPVMIGLLKPNNMIRASYRQKAIELQQKTGQKLSQIPLSVLHRELGFSNSSLLCLSPTDSIIEAIRCAVELDIPVFGIDLEEMACGIYQNPAMIQHPPGEAEDLRAFINRNAAFAAHLRDEEIDTRREIAMTARLKALMRDFPRVVFTCGLAHWSHIQRHLDDSSIKPALITDMQSHKGNGFKRVIVHPCIAVEYMAYFPALTKKYEKLRRPAYEENQGNILPDLSPAYILQSLLKKAYHSFFINNSKKDHHRFDTAQDLQAQRQFEGYLQNLCLLRHRIVPDIPMIVTAAEETMSNAFVQTLTKTLMAFPWVTPLRLKGLPIVASSPRDQDGSLCSVSEENNPASQGIDCYIYSSPGNRRFTSQIDYTWEEMKNKADKPAGKIDYHLYTWSPWDYLITAMSLHAIRYAKRKQYKQTTDVFAGNVFEGIDIKASLREYSRGKETIYVRDSIKKNVCDGSLNEGGFPVVWILKPGKHPGAEFHPLSAKCDGMEKYARNRMHFNANVSSKSDRMVAIVGYGDLNIATKASEIAPSIRSDRYYGALIYHPLCWTLRQFTIWAEVTDFHRNPYCHENRLLNCSLLEAIMMEKHGKSIKDYDWSTVLMFLAIPYAKTNLTVIAPHDYQIDPMVFKRAKQFGIDVGFFPLSGFPQERLERIAINHMVPVSSHDPECIYPNYVEKALGEGQTDNREFVSERVLNFGAGLKNQRESYF